MAVLLAGSLGYGEWRLRQNDFTPGPQVALVQSNLALLLEERGLGGGAGRAGPEPCASTRFGSPTSP